jgi:hypothetical protein
LPLRNPKPNQPQPSQEGRVQSGRGPKKALAFVTLLSSQETDTTLEDPHRALSGATLLTYHPQPVCQPPNLREDQPPAEDRPYDMRTPQQTTPRRITHRRNPIRAGHLRGVLHPVFGVTHTLPVPPGARARTHRSDAGPPPGPGRLSASRSPWGEKNITFVRDLGQIEPQTPRFNHPQQG